MIKSTKQKLSSNNTSLAQFHGSKNEKVLMNRKRSMKGLGNFGPNYNC